jgi:acyl dehydratase
MACVLGHPATWIRDLDTGVDFERVVHGEQDFFLHRPLEPAGRVIGKTRVTEIIDKGPGKGAIVHTERVVTDAGTGDRIATLHQTTFCRGDGGFGGPQRASPPAHAVPDRAPDAVRDLSTRPESALIYRLSGDRNPLHADPAAARAAGFDRPILHGLATFGIACRAIVDLLCPGSPERVVGLAGRFSAPVFPGETIRTELWMDGGVVSYRARVLERDVIAIGHGRAELTSS